MPETTTPDFLNIAYQNINEIFNSKIRAPATIYAQLASDNKPSYNVLALYKNHMKEFRKKVIPKINKSYLNRSVDRHYQTLNMIECALNAINKLELHFDQVAKRFANLERVLNSSGSADLKQCISTLEEKIIPAFKGLMEPLQVIQAANDKESAYRQHILPLLLQMSEEDEEGYQQLTKSVQQFNSNSDPISFLSNPIGDAPRFYPSILLCVGECLKNLKRSPITDETTAHITAVDSILSQVNFLAKRDNSGKSGVELKAFDLDQFASVSQRIIEIEQKQQEYLPIAKKSNQNRKNLREMPMGFFKSITISPKPKNQEVLGQLSKNKNKAQDILVLMKDINESARNSLELENLLNVLKGSDYNYLRQTGVLGRFSRHYTVDILTKEPIKTSKSWAVLESAINKKITESKGAISKTLTRKS